MQFLNTSAAEHDDVGLELEGLEVHAVLKETCGQIDDVFSEDDTTCKRSAEGRAGRCSGQSAAGRRDVRNGFGYNELIDGATIEGILPDLRDRFGQLERLERSRSREHGIPDRGHTFGQIDRVERNRILEGVRARVERVDADHVDGLELALRKDGLSDRLESFAEFDAEETGSTEREVADRVQRSREGDGPEGNAPVERSDRERADALFEDDIPEFGASRKDVVPHLRIDGIVVETLESAVREGILSNLGDRFGNGNGRQLAVREGILSDLGDRFGNDEGRERGAVEGVVPDRGVRPVKLEPVRGELGRHAAGLFAATLKDSRSRQPAKALSPIDVSSAGMTTETRPEFMKAAFPTDVMLSKLKLVRLEHPRNTFPAILVHAAGRMTSLSSLQSWKVLGTPVAEVADWPSTLSAVLLRSMRSSPHPTKVWFPR